MDEFFSFVLDRFLEFLGYVVPIGPVRGGRLKRRRSPQMINLTPGARRKRRRRFMR